MINQALFSSKDKCKDLKCRLLKILFGASGLVLDWAYLLSKMHRGFAFFRCLVGLHFLLDLSFISLVLFHYINYSEPSL